MTGHIPCQLSTITEFIKEHQCKTVVDCTAGEGGHTIAIASIVGESGRIIAIEVDPTYFSIIKTKTSNFNNVICVRESYTQIGKIVESLSITKVDAILFDFGLSSYHLDASQRGFSFKKDEILDMRFNPEEGEPLCERLKKMKANEIEKVLKIYGETSFYKKLANLIFENRSKIKTTSDLNEIIKKAIPPRFQKNEFPKIYQAFRIFVNNEVQNMIVGLREALKYLSKGGFLLTLSYHSIEDRICKSIKNVKGIKAITKKPIITNEEESLSNPRCRSAKLRIYQKEEVNEEDLLNWYRDIHSICVIG